MLPFAQSCRQPPSHQPHGPAIAVEELVQRFLGVEDIDHSLGLSTSLPADRGACGAGDHGYGRPRHTTAMLHTRQAAADDRGKISTPLAFCTICLEPGRSDTSSKAVGPVSTVVASARGAEEVSRLGRR